MSQVTSKEVYDLVESMRKEIKSDMASTSSHLLATIQRVEMKFDTMEAGRLTRLEKDFAGLQGRLVASMFFITLIMQIIFYFATNGHSLHLGG